MQVSLAFGFTSQLITPRQPVDDNILEVKDFEKFLTNRIKAVAAMGCTCLINRSGSCERLLEC